MKCHYCNTELKQGAKFCPNCGKEVLAEDKCFNCGGHIKSGALFCPHCGAKQQRIESNATEQPIQETPIVSTNEEVITEQPQNIAELSERPIEDDAVNKRHNDNNHIHESSDDNLANTIEPYESGRSSKKWLWILGIILLLGIVGGGWYFFNEGYFGKKAMAPTEEATDSIAENDSIFEEEYDIHSVEGVKQCMTAILNKGLYMSDEDAVKAYFSNEFKDVYNKVVEYDKKNIPEGELGFWDFSLWGDGQGGLGKFHFDIKDVKNVKESTALVLVDYISDEFDNLKCPTIFNLVFENGSWVIDEVTDENNYSYKEAMIKYLDKEETIRSGTFSMVGHVSQDNIHMNIEIDNTSVKGHYYYDSRGNSNQVRLEGMIDDNGNMKLTMYGSDGEAIGYFSGTFDGSTYSGLFVHNSIEENLPFSVSVQ